MSKVSALYHIVFSTQYRQPTLTEAALTDLYRFIWGIITRRKCTLVRIGGTSTHLHLLIYLPPTLTLTDLMTDVKGTASLWLRSNPAFPSFSHWAKEYVAVTISEKEKASLIDCINNQKISHATLSFEDEMASLYAQHGLTMHRNDFTK